MTDTANGVLQMQGKSGFLRDAAVSFQPMADDVRVSSRLIRTYGLVEGATVTGPIRDGKRGRELTDVTSICGLTPEAFQARTPFERLTAINPDERFRLGAGGNPTMRMVELIAPMGKGTRGLIVAPPKAGKTRILAELAQAVHATEPETRIVVLLIDERPEEVTEFRRNVPAEVLASSSDQSLSSHVNLAELTMAHVRCELECGRDVVVLVDSITRMTRAFNLSGRGAGRTLSGGVDAKALEIPRRFFGLARNIENGGSVTVIATALVDTGSRMDDLIFEEFKSTGNSELVLDRELAEARIFPAINLAASGTRNEALLYADGELPRLITLRRWLADGKPAAAMRGMNKLIDMTATNEELLRRLAPAE
ncbi:MAG: transcription termination factor Rho [Caldilineaceae bacterium]|nr:transcription termination factor Rho [Caldilineaceae bacterium]